ncbi:MAG: 4Fe-4S dicluster domain-containing protein [Candidatus Lokiarchaeota archaeon]|nr:4Fe-4S dicluster domain-containing protein [Candidatus Lokiarchaeota archaeon]
MLEQGKGVYDKLRVHLDNMPIGYPETKSGVEIKILKALFTPQQAYIATFLNWKWQDIETIYQSFPSKENISQEDFELQLTQMVKDGLINYRHKAKKKQYANAPLVVGFYEYQLKRLNKELIKDVFHYIKEAFGYEIMRTNISQLRTVPIEQSIESKINVSTYNNIRKIFETASPPFAVADCICKIATDMIQRPCKVTKRREICMAVDWMAQLYIDQEWGREISKKEALNILKKNEEDGLILNVENTQESLFFCGCCTCCCGITAGLKNLHNPSKLAQNNYYAILDLESCAGCGACIERCQMEAISLKGDKATIKKKRCIGCGNCVLACPSNAISLRFVEDPKKPPETSEKLYNSILLEKNQLKEKYKKFKSH